MASEAESDTESLDGSAKVQIGMVVREVLVEDFSKLFNQQLEQAMNGKIYKMIAAMLEASEQSLKEQIAEIVTKMVREQLQQRFQATILPMTESSLVDIEMAQAPASVLATPSPPKKRTRTSFEDFLKKKDTKSSARSASAKKPSKGSRVECVSVSSAAKRDEAAINKFLESYIGRYTVLTAKVTKRSEAIFIMGQLYSHITTYCRIPKHLKPELHGRVLNHFTSQTKFCLSNPDIAQIQAHAIEMNHSLTPGLLKTGLGGSTQV